MTRFRTYLAVALVGMAGGASMLGAAPAGQFADEGGKEVPDARSPRGDVQLVVDLSDRQLHVVSGDDIVRSYAVAVGKPEHPTPTGEFHIRRLVWNPRWVPPDAKWARGKRARAPGDPRNPMGRVKIFFKEPDYYIHGTREVDSLGQAESHGCVRMRNAEVTDLAKIVMDAGGQNRSPGWFQRVLNRVRQTQEVRLTDPVRVKVRE